MNYLETLLHLHGAISEKLRGINGVYELWFHCMPNDFNLLSHWGIGKYWNGLFIYFLILRDFRDHARHWLKFFEINHVQIWRQTDSYSIPGASKSSLSRPNQHVPDLSLKGVFTSEKGSWSLWARLHASGSLGVWGTLFSRYGISPHTCCQQIRLLF